MSRSFRRCCLVTVEAGYQEEALKKQEEKKIRSKELDAENRWWVAELLAADCEKAWLHPGEEETMRKWYVRLEK